MEVIKFIQQFSNPFLDVFFSIITNLGGQTIGVVTSLILFWCIDKKLGFKFLYAMLFSFSLNNILKGFFNAKRPIGTEGIISGEINTATGSSFPSGHSQGNGTAFAFLMNQYRNKLVWIVGIAMLILVPLSRLYLGVHWPIDVIMGTLIGILSVFISNKIFDNYYNNSSHIIIYTTIVFLVLGVFLPSEDLLKALGALSALTISLLLERSFLNFDPSGTTSQHIIKVLIGVIGALLIYLIISPILTHGIFLFIKYFLLIFWATFICPIIFLKLHLCNKSI
ncbi:MAG: phosphatase PAP2 family protein [Clostridium baratii]|uniref:PAP2 superfamily protein n=1 Tax=Clostridium baratii str. Sullivan TaxID=1415775 RepID=A0A0A7FYR4_9CLOT|nr:phosphatase PAP2 family protein [Clostridium baratii]AIY84080.1 PAP2 superfamily protein [Clostridium baratii str. Sullivan]MBS6007457.1 phosphatase PAP2 family protein [Clostridium baratii]MDU1054812.1 phosphatase PAP2 family protein [Clostridium baratii]MDU4911943.1 phosphatase PAP2 family protein [Clostridium baratii]